jgi:hypothetical protein
MKVTNISNNRIYLSDLKVVHASQTEARRSEDRYLGPGAAAYLQNTSEVLRSAVAGDLKGFSQAGAITLEDQVDLEASGGADTTVLTHNFGFAPVVYVLKQVVADWVDATGTVDIIHNSGFTTTTITNVTAFPMTFYIRLL